MRIMICDDDKPEREAFLRCVEKVWPESRIEETDSAGTLLQLIRKGKAYDLIFLDIYMNDMDGIEAGRWIHDNFPEMNMVFISNSRDFGPEVFEINALHYLVKPCEQSTLEEVRRRYEERHRREGVALLYSKTKQESIPFLRIAYIESEHNNLRIHLINGSDLTVRDSIQNYMNKLDERFLRINRGVIVNMEVVDRMNVDSCEISGKIFMLSRKTRKESRKRYKDYIFERAMRAF